VELPLLTLFENPTLKSMSAEIERLIIEKLEDMSEDEVRALLGPSEDRAAS
jgi:hypothetical protein